MIHYENYRRFSKGQGYIGSMCRPAGGPMATSARWFATDCRDCKRKIAGRRVINQIGEVGEILSVEVDGVWIRDQVDLVSWRWLDEFWAPMPPIAEIFGLKDGEIA